MPRRARILRPSIRSCAGVGERLRAKAMRCGGGDRYLPSRRAPSQPGREATREAFEDSHRGETAQALVGAVPAVEVGPQTLLPFLDARELRFQVVDVPLGFGVCLRVF